MEDNRFDVIVIGAGMAGLCCTGELVLQGARPLLISEAKEVGFALRSQMVEGNRGIVQAPTYQVGWGGGWWPGLVRRLNIPVSVPKGFGVLDYVPMIQELGIAPQLPQCSLSGASLADTLVELFPPLADLKDEFNRVLHSALSIPYPELIRMHDVPLSQWLEDQKADELVSHFMVTLGSLIVATSAEFCREHVSVFGAFGFMRSAFCGEAAFGFVYPDARQGFAIPVAKEIERRGGVVWRGSRVAQVSAESGRVGTVTMEDGREATAPIVAMACGTARIADLLPAVPPELAAPLAYGKEIAHQDFNVFAVLDKPVVPDDTRFMGVMTMEGSMVQWMGALHNVAPWTAQPGKQFVICGSILRPDEVMERGGESTVLSGMLDVADTYFPGFKDATEAVGNFAHKAGHLWYGHSTAGPKLPMKSESVEGLWFVSEACQPVGGVWMEHAASVGIRGAQTMKPS